MGTTFKLTWKGKQTREQIAHAAVAALSEFDLRVETDAKAELYPGHGKRTGVLQRAIEGSPARLEGSRVRGAIGTKGVRYALVIHKHYGYIVEGLKKNLTLLPQLLQKHVGGK